MIYESLSIAVTIMTLELIDHVPFCLLSRGRLPEKMDVGCSSWQDQGTRQNSQRSKAKSEESQIHLCKEYTSSPSLFSAIQKTRNTQNHKKFPNTESENL